MERKEREVTYENLYKFSTTITAGSRAKHLVVIHIAETNDTSMVMIRTRFLVENDKVKRCYAKALRTIWNKTLCEREQYFKPETFGTIVKFYNHTINQINELEEAK